MLTANIGMGDLTLNMFTTVKQSGTALDTGVAEILIEGYLPANDACREFFVRLSIQGTSDDFRQAPGLQPTSLTRCRCADVPASLQRLIKRATRSESLDRLA